MIQNLYINKENNNEFIYSKPKQKTNKETN